MNRVYLSYVHLMKGPNNSHTQVFYLDNVEIGDWDMDHSVLPRIFKSQKDGQLLRLRHPPRRPKLPQPSDHAFDGPDRAKQQLLSVIRLLLWSQSIKYILRLPILGPDPSIGKKKSRPHHFPVLPHSSRGSHGCRRRRSRLPFLSFSPTAMHRLRPRRWSRGAGGAQPWRGVAG